MKNLLLALSCTISFGVLGVIAYQFIHRETPVSIALGGPFELTHHTGKTVTDESYRGRYMLVYFGFTNCPAVCPGSLLQMTNILRRLEETDAEAAKQVTPVFVSVDPERDTPQVIADYISHFHERFEGLTGTQAQLADLVRSYGSYFSYSPLEDGSDDYTVNHSSFLYLVGPNGQYLTHFTTGEPSDQIIERIKQRLDIG